jgi:adenine-specific DNA-methyltransferase
MIVPASKYLLAILNSKIADYYIRSLGVTRNGGYFEYKPMFIEQLPVPIIEKNQQKLYSTIVQEILIRRENGVETEEYERRLELMIFNLYQLSYDERDYLMSKFN